MATNSLTGAFINLRNDTTAHRNLRTHHDYVSENCTGLGIQNLQRLYQNLFDTNLPHSSQCLQQSCSKSQAQLPRREWLEKMESVTADAKRIESNMSEVSALRTKRLIVNFESDEMQHDREIDMKTREITDLFRHAEGLLADFNDQGQGSKISETEASVITNMKRSQAKKLQGLHLSYKTAQKEFINRRQIQMSGGGAQVIFSASDEDSNSEMPDDGWNDTQLAKAANCKLGCNMRDMEIMKIANTVEELANIFKDLAAMVIDQGTILDRIDFNMECAVDNATVGAKHLREANRHQENDLQMKFIIALVALIAIMLIVLMVKSTPKSN